MFPRPHTFSWLTQGQLYPYIMILTLLHTISWKLNFAGYKEYKTRGYSRLICGAIFGFPPRWAQQTPLGLDTLIIEALRSHSDTPHSVGLLWTSGRPIAEISTRTTHNIHNRQTSKLPAGFEPTIQASEGPETHVLDGAVTGISSVIVENVENHEGIRSGRRFVGGRSKQALPCYKPAELQLEATSAVLL